MDDSELDLQAALNHVTDRLICSARTLAFWVADDDDLPTGAEVPSEESAARAVGETYEAIAQIQFIRLEIAGQIALFGDTTGADAGVPLEPHVIPYAGTPRRGPSDRTCRQCDFLQVGRIGRAEKTHPFCRLVADRMGPMFVGDRPKAWTGTPACEHYRPISGLV